MYKSIQQQKIHYLLNRLVKEDFQTIYNH